MPGFHRLRPSYDFLVVGGGHAGLQAGLKAALMNYTALVLDRGPKFSRSFYAPKMDNIPGHPDGISGHKLLDTQVAALRTVESQVGHLTPARAVAARAADGGFEVDFDWLGQRQTARGKVLVLAMGVVDRMPEIDGKIDPIFPWANLALVDFCEMCDGHELKGKRIAVLGHDAFAARTALDLVHFQVGPQELLTLGRPFLEGVPEEERASLSEALDAAKIGHDERPVAGFDGIRERRFDVRFTDGTLKEFDRGFSALGWYEMNQALPLSLGCRFDPEGFVATDEDCRAIAESTGQPIPGLYVVGDLRSGWNQIPEAWATAERAVIHAWASYL